MVSVSDMEKTDEQCLRLHDSLVRLKVKEIIADQSCESVPQLCMATAVRQPGQHLLLVVHLDLSEGPAMPAEYSAEWAGKLSHHTTNFVVASYEAAGLSDDDLDALVLKRLRASFKGFRKVSLYEPDLMNVNVGEGNDTGPKP